MATNRKVLKAAAMKRLATLRREKSLLVREAEKTIGKNSIETFSKYSRIKHLTKEQDKAWKIVQSLLRYEMGQSLVDPTC